MEVHRPEDAFESVENDMSSPKVWRTMWEATGKLAGKFGLTLPGESAMSQAEKPATRCPCCEQKLRYAHEKAGKEAKCPRCSHRFSLPAKPRPVAPKFSSRVGYSVIRERL